MSTQSYVLVCPSGLPGTESLGGHTPGRLADTALSFAPASTMGMVNRVHCHSSHNRPPTKPSGRSSLAYLCVLMLGVGHCTHCCHAVTQHRSLFPRGQPYNSILLICSAAAQVSPQNCICGNNISSSGQSCTDDYTSGILVKGRVE